MDIGLGIKRIHFFRALSDSSKAGINPLRTLDIMSSRGSFLPAATVEGLRRMVRGGSPLSQAMRAYPESFPLWQTEIVRVGEATGRMDSVFASIADSLDEQRTFVLDLLPGLLYPLFLLHAAPFLFNGPIIITKGVQPYLMAVLGFLLWFYVPAAALAFVCSSGLVRLRSLPLLSALSRVRFSHFLCAMLKAGVPFMKALEIAASASDIPPKGPPPPQGAGMAEHLRNYAVFSPDDLSHIEAAEMSGTMGEALDRLSEHSRQTWRATLKSITTMLPPLFYLAISLGIGYRIFVSLRPFIGAPLPF